MKTKAINWLLKALLAGAAAFALLCLFCALWYKVPVHSTNPDGATEFKYEPNTFYSRGVEGFAMGRTNSDGFPELRDYAPGDQVDVLLLGSDGVMDAAHEEDAVEKATSIMPHLPCKFQSMLSLDKSLRS